jgi:hypothetical protein
LRSCSTSNPRTTRPPVTIDPIRRDPGETSQDQAL